MHVNGALNLDKGFFKYNGVNSVHLESTSFVSRLTRTQHMFLMPELNPGKYEAGGDESSPGQV